MPRKYDVSLLFLVRKKQGSRVFRLSFEALVEADQSLDPSSALKVERSWANY